MIAYLAANISFKSNSFYRCTNYIAAIRFKFS